MGASPHPMADEGQGPDDPNKIPCEITGYPPSSPCRERLIGRMQYAPTHSDENNRPEVYGRLVK